MFRQNLKFWKENKSENPDRKEQYENDPSESLSGHLRDEIYRNKMN